MTSPLEIAETPEIAQIGSPFEDEETGALRGGPGSYPGDPAAGPGDQDCRWRHLSPPLCPWLARTNQGWSLSGATRPVVLVSPTEPSGAWYVEKLLSRAITGLQRGKTHKICTLNRRVTRTCDTQTQDGGPRTHHALRSTACFHAPWASPAHVRGGGHPPRERGLSPCKAAGSPAMPGGVLLLPVPGLPGV